MAAFFSVHEVQVQSKRTEWLTIRLQGHIRIGAYGLAMGLAPKPIGWAASRDCMVDDHWNRQGSPLIGYSL